MRYPETARLIRSARLRKGVSQQNAALAVGCSRLQFIRWEQGLHRPLEFRDRLVENLGIDRDSLEHADDDEEAATVPKEIKILVVLFVVLFVLLLLNPWTVWAIVVELGVLCAYLEARFVGRRVKRWLA